jgi:hypothetical protein
VLSRIEGWRRCSRIPAPAPARGVAGGAVGATALDEPLWWPALTGYVAQVQAAWLAFASAGRPAHPQLRVIFTMLGGLAPLHAERLRARGGPELALADPLTFYETSSYGPNARETLELLVGEGQILFGSDRPLVEPANGLAPSEREWDRLAQNTRRALGAPAPLTAGSSAAPRRTARPAAGARHEVSLQALTRLRCAFRARSHQGYGPPATPRPGPSCGSSWVAHENRCAASEMIPRARDRG